MKHKAQEALDEKDYISTIRQSIDCQLTEDELDIICDWISDSLVHATLMNDFEAMNVLTGIRNKLKNQKEMWKEE